MPILVFIFGLIVGSFLNAVIARLHSRQSIFAPSSRCPRCDHLLAWSDLIPLVSFFMLKRRCRYCQKPISWQYPLVELATAVAFLLIFNFQFSIFNFIFACFLIVIFVYDLKHYLILDKIVLPAAALAFAYQGYQGNLGQALLGAVTLGSFFGLLYLVSRGRWIGVGDIKLGIFLGLLVPWPQTLVLFFLAYFLGAFVSVILLMAGKKKMSDRLPFGTFLTVAAFVAMLWGEEIISWYFGLIGVY